MAAVEGTTASQGSLFHVAADVWKRMAGNGEMPVKPELLKKHMARLNPMFAGNGEHDAHEFCLELLNQLHDELAAAQKKADLDGPAAELPTQLFDFSCNQKLVCTSCGYTRDKTELYRDLSVDLTEGVRSDAETMLRQHFHPEELELRCEECCGTKAKSSRSVLSSPAVLSMHLKRFLPDAKWSRIEKRGSPVAFPEKMCWNEESFCLQSVVCHIGESASTGHYVCYAREGDRWQEFNDSRVRQLDSLPQSTERSAYLLFYVRTSVTSPAGQIAETTPHA
jgi:ubiquitin C-terminal hydrolase